MLNVLEIHTCAEEILFSFMLSIVVNAEECPSTEAQDKLATGLHSSNIVG